MAQGGFFQPAGAGLRHTMRFLQKRSGDMMPRGEFVRKVLRGVVKVDPVGVYCMQVNLAVRGFDVTFVSGVAFEAAMKRCKEAEDEEPLCSFNVESLERRSFKVVTTHLYNPYVSDEMVAGFLSRYGKVQSGVPVPPRRGRDLDREEAVQGPPERGSRGLRRAGAPPGLLCHRAGQGLPFLLQAAPVLQAV